MTTGERLKQLRDGLSQKAAALACGLKQQYWNRWEHDQTELSSDSIRKICTTFGVSADWLLGLQPQGVSVNAAEGAAVAIGPGASAAVTAAVEEKCSECPHLKKLKRLQRAFGA